MDTYWTGYICGIITGAAALQLFLMKTGRYKSRDIYRWKCPEEECGFETTSPNSAQGVLRLADIHTQQCVYKKEN